MWPSFKNRGFHLTTNLKARLGSRCYMPLLRASSYYSSETPKTLSCNSLFPEYSGERSLQLRGMMSSNNESNANPTPISDSSSKNEDVKEGSTASALKGTESDNTSSIVGSKKKYALLFGYSGIGYKGLQINGEVKTIELDLYEAICKTGVVKAANQQDLKKIGWSRAARTDKGVHAVGQVVAMKLCLKPGSEDVFVNKLNGFLPANIKVFDCIRLANSFNAKFQCAGRIYEYWIPAYMLCPESMKIGESKTKVSKEEEKGDGEEVSLEELQGYRETLRTLELEESRLDLLKKCLKMYEGTKDFHNFTPKIAHNDPARKRFISSFNTFEPVLVGDLKMIKVQVEGQSFMLHQIRNMIGLAVEITRRGLSSDLIQQALTDEWFGLPMAPGEGLALQACLYGPYNNKHCVKIEKSDSLIGFVPEKQEDLLKRRPIQFQSGRIGSLAEEFSLKTILTAIVKKEEENCVFTRWIYLRNKEEFPRPVTHKNTGTYSDYANYKSKKAESKRIHKELKMTNRNGEVTKKAKVDANVEKENAKEVEAMIDK